MRWLFFLLLVLNLSYWYWSEHANSTYAKAASVLEPPRSMGQGIQLISEAKEVGGARASEQQNPRCLFLGGLRSEQRVRQVAQRLLSLDIHSTLGVVESVKTTEYWVYLPPLPSREGALRRLRELQVKKIDSFIINQGDLLNGISLGVFKRQESAEVARERFKADGYDVTVRAVPRMQQGYWVELGPESVPLVDRALLESLRDAFPGLKQEQKQCGGLQMLLGLNRIAPAFRWSPRADMSWGVAEGAKFKFFKEKA